MALKRLSIIALCCLSTTMACRRDAEPPPEPERADLSVTRWTDRTELFAEFAALTAGENSRFAIHLTALQTFKPLLEGRVAVKLRGGTAPEENFTVDGPSRPGIFGVDVKPAHAGRRELVISLNAEGLSDEHIVGPVDVYPDMAASIAANAVPEEEAPGISFLKEQQWTLDFAIAVVTPQSLRESVRVPARVEPRPGGSADVVAPIGGRIAFALDAPVGTAVTAGQELARLAPPAGNPGDLPQLQRAVAESKASLAQAGRDRERAERLTSAGAAPARRLDDARYAEESARLRLTAAEAELAQFNATRSGAIAGQPGLFSVRAPITGVLAHRNAVSGANVAQGTVLFRVVDAARVHVVGQVPESEAVRARLAIAAEVEVPGQPDRVPAGKRVSVGSVLDAASRTLPVTFALDNSRDRLPVGRTVILHLLGNETAAAPAVPSAAVVDDAGRPIVFVQREGETFERRAVSLGVRSGGLVQITEGLKPGDRVVTKGAYLVRLAALSTTVPAHGHVH